MTLAPMAHALARADGFLRRRWKKGFLPPGWESLARFAPSIPSGAAKVSDGPRLWAHAASLGEVAGLWNVLLDLPECKRLVVTAQTPGGMARWRQNIAVLQGGRPDIWPHIAPFDHPRLAARFLSRWGITHILLYEGEIWPGWMMAAAKAGIPVLWVAARCPEASFRRWRRFPALTARLLSGLHFVQARSEIEAGRIQTFCRQSVAVGSDAKAWPHGPMARLGLKPPKPPNRPKGLALYCLYRGEWPWVKPLVLEWMKRGEVFVMPRRREDFAFFRRELRPMGFSFHSENTGAYPSEGRDRRYVLVDAFGQTQPYWPQCRVALVGGSWIPLGGHAFWEPLRHGIRLWSGPHLHHQQPMADELKEAGLLKVCLGPDLVRQVGVENLEPSSDGDYRQAYDRFWEKMKVHRERSLGDIRAALSLATTKTPVSELSFGSS